MVEELEVRAEVPALAMEEALPTAASTASLKVPPPAPPACGKEAGLSVHGAIAVPLNRIRGPGA